MFVYTENIDAGNILESRTCFQVAWGWGRGLGGRVYMEMNKVLQWGDEDLGGFSFSPRDLCAYLEMSVI